VTLVDTNVLLDVFTKDPKWLGWSLMRLEEAAFEGPLLINDVICAETSTHHRGFQTGAGRRRHCCGADTSDDAISGGQGFHAIPQCRRHSHRRARRFFVGAHAAVEQLPLLTRDARRYRNYFPTVVLITPEGD
jgi:predicted nucleic acid-binding protein